MTLRIVLALSLLLSTQVLAETPAPTPSESKRAAILKLRQRIQEVAMKLQTIQKKVVKDRPDLVKRQKDLRDLIDGMMKKKGIDPEKEMSEVMVIQGMLGNPDQKMSKKKLKELKEKLRKKGLALQRAHEAASNAPKVKKAQKAFRKEMESAMTKVDPAAKKLLKEFYVLRKQMKELFPNPPR